MLFTESNKYNKDLEKYQGMLGTKADGLFGEDTLAKTLEFQGQQGLKQDGKIGKNTIAALDSRWNKQSSVADLKKNATGDINIGNITTGTPIGTNFDAAKDLADKKAVIGPVDNSVDKGITPTPRTGTTTNKTTSAQDLAKLEIEKRETELKAMETDIQNITSDRNKDYETTGLFDKMRSRTEMEKQIKGLKQQQMQIGSEADTDLKGRGGTDTDYRNLTGQALRDNSKKMSESTLSLAEQNANIKLQKDMIDMKYSGMKEDIGFIYNQKKDRLDDIKDRYWKKMDTEDQRNWNKTQKSIEAKQKNDLVNIEDDKELRSTLAELGYDEGDISTMSNNELYDKIGDQTARNALNERIMSMKKKGSSGISFNANGNPILSDSSEGVNSMVMAKNIIKVENFQNFNNKFKGKSTDLGEAYESISEVGNFAAATNGGIANYKMSNSDMSNGRKILGMIQQDTSEKTLDYFIELKNAGATFGAMSDAEWAILGSSVDAVKNAFVMGKEADGTAGKLMAVSLSPAEIKEHMGNIQKIKTSVAAKQLYRTLNPDLTDAEVKQWGLKMENESAERTTAIFNSLNRAYKKGNSFTNTSANGIAKNKIDNA